MSVNRTEQKKEWLHKISGLTTVNCKAKQNTFKEFGPDQQKGVTSWWKMDQSKAHH